MKTTSGLTVLAAIAASSLTTSVQATVLRQNVAIRDVALNHDDPFPQTVSIAPLAIDLSKLGDVRFSFNGFAAAGISVLCREGYSCAEGYDARFTPRYLLGLAFNSGPTLIYQDVEDLYRFGLGEGSVGRQYYFNDITIGSVGVRTFNGGISFRIDEAVDYSAYGLRNLGGTSGAFQISAIFNRSDTSLTIDIPILEELSLEELASATAAGYRLSSGSAEAVPEPVTWVMMIMGFGVVGASMRQRRTGTSLSLS